MDDAIFDSIGIFAFVIGWVLLQLWTAKRKRTRAQQLPGGAAPAPMAPIPPDALDRLATRLADLDRRLADARKVVRAEGGRTAAISDALDDAIETVIRGHRIEHARLTQAVGQGVPVETLGGPVHHLLAGIDRTWRRLQVIDGLLAARRDPVVGDRLADGDAVAAAFWEPFAAFASIEGLNVPTVEPIAAPRGTMPEAALIHALPGHPVVFVPRDFDLELYRWTSVPHELAHVVYRSVPSLAAEMRARLGVDDGRQILMNRRLRMADVGRRAMSAWFEEWFCDWLTVVMCGAAGVRGLIELFADHGQAALVTASLAADGHYAPHPPPVLRIMVASALLYRMGQDRESIELMREWQARASAHEHIVLPTAHGAVTVPMRPIFDLALATVNAWYETQWQSLAGRTFSDIHGLEMTPGLWARVMARAQDHEAGVEFVDDPRVVVCSAMIARHRNPGMARTILQSTRRAIVGVGAPLGERRASGRRARRRAGGDSVSRRRLFGEALVWTEVLKPATGQSPHAR